MTVATVARISIGHSAHWGTIWKNGPPSARAALGLWSTSTPWPR